MPQTLVVDQLIEEARMTTGLERFDSNSYREGLEVLVADLNREAPGEKFVEKNRKDLTAALAMRLRTTAYLTERPDLLERPIERPLFVFGVPRTGTTLISNLLAADPNRRSPLTWEIDNPIPPVKANALHTDPRALARLEQEKQMLKAYPDMGKYYRNSAIYPNECMFFINQDFKALMWEGRGKLANYREFLFNQADLTSTYTYHKRFLQLLQADAPGVWNLKQPSHGLWLETLLKVYPDARLVWTHRDPLTATGSFCSLMTLSNRSSTDNDNSAWIGENYPWQAVRHADAIMDARERIGHDRVIDVHYADLMRNPIPTMRTLYAALGDPFTAEAESAMQGWINDNPQDKFGKHEYKLAQYGLTPDGVRKKFERYLSQYDVEAEG
jgi:Sulfotransferase family